MSTGPKGLSKCVDMNLQHPFISAALSLPQLPYSGAASASTSYKVDVRANLSIRKEALLECQKTPHEEVGWAWGVGAGADAMPSGA